VQADANRSRTNPGYLTGFHVAEAFWYWFTAFAGVNVLPSGFTKWCPTEDILKKLGAGVRTES
jgi:hypothetical protein